MEPTIRNETAVVISDLHVADPEINSELKRRGLDDFTKDDDFARLLLEIIPRRAGWPSTLIINGDFIDFVQVLPELGRHSAGERFGVTQDYSRLKLGRVFRGHPRVFDALGEFLARGGQVLVLPGNHDIDLHWDGVFDDFRQRLGGVGEPQLRFIREGKIMEQGVYIEHGNQYSYDNWFEFWDNPIKDAPDDRQRLERPWGTLFLDMIYNDIKDLYSFSNKVYPHAELAWIVLRSFRNDSNVSAKAIARLALFFARQGKRFLFEHLMGERPKSDVDSSLPLEEVLKSAGGEISQERLAEIRAETAKLMAEDKRQEELEVPPSGKGEGGLTGLMGRNDAWGMSKRQDELLESGEVTLVAFGHTHTPVDGEMHPPYGTQDKRRAFNTGSWIPKIPIGPQEKPYWKDLAAKPGVSDVRYLLLELKPYPKARLEPLLPPDK